MTNNDTRSVEELAREFAAQNPLPPSLVPVLAALLATVRNEERDACMILAATFAHGSHGSLPSTPRECQAHIAHKISAAIRARTP